MGERQKNLDRYNSDVSISDTENPQNFDASLSEDETKSLSSSEAENSMGHILSKLLKTSSNDAAPILSKRRAVERAIADEALEKRARYLVRQESKAARDAAHTPAVIDNKEKVLRRTAVKGVVRLFNAVHQYQQKKEREKAAREDKVQKGDKKELAAAVGEDKPKADIKAISKATFLELLKMGGTKK